MGTRSTTTIYDGDEPIVTIYRQFDGYPSGQGTDLSDFLAGKTIVNGFGAGDTSHQFNGAGDLAMRLITALKGGNANDIGGFYVMPFSAVGESGEDYIYEVRVPSHGDLGVGDNNPCIRIVCFDCPYKGTPVEIISATADEFAAAVEAFENAASEDDEGALV